MGRRHEHQAARSHDCLVSGCSPLASIFAVRQLAARPVVVGQRSYERWSRIEEHHVDVLDRVNRLERGWVLEPAKLSVIM